MPHRAPKPRKIAPAACEFFTLAQGISDVGSFENRKLLPEQKIYEQPANYPHLKPQDDEGEKEQRHRGTGHHDHQNDTDRQNGPKKVSAIDKDAEHRDARPKLERIL